ncbi:MAG: carboxypeptidase regulatory-like domain-containing protein [Acidobacteria bacterium]|nr:carboxypeptidase regulatory-like domain-containing protein [Acidobacteriota bacterium]
MGILRCLTVLLGLTVPAFPQATAVVQISGTVYDPAGAAVAEAQIKALNADTGLVRILTSGTDGAYRVPNLPVGRYRIEVTASGFKSYAQEGIVLQVNANPVINIQLELGQVSQEVQVTANAAMAETQSNSISQVIDNQRVVELPLNGRDPTQLVLLSGAAVIAPPSDLKSSKNYPSSAAISVAGGQSNGTYYLLDGGDHADSFGLINLPLPFPDAVQEFSVQTNAIPANYGVRAGAVVNMVTRSGTNEFHGNLFHFLRTGATNARNFFATDKDSLKRNQFGGTIGGPIFRNKLFVFGGFQGTRVRTAPPTSTSFVATQAVQSGDFSLINSTACGVARNVIDPTTGAAFPGNRIPVSRFSGPAVEFMKLVPVSTDPCGRLQISIPNPTDEDQFIGRSDYNKSERHSLFGRYYFTDLRNPAAWDGKNLLLTTRPGVLDRVQSLTIGDTYSLTPTMINSIHVTWTRERITRGPAPGLPTARSIGLNVADSPDNFPNISVSGKLTTFCGTCSKAFINSGSMQFAEDLSWVRGKHQFSFGGEYIRRYLNFQVSTQQNAAYSFTGIRTNDPLADMYLGLPNSFTQGNLTQTSLIHHYTPLYVNDKIRLSKSLSFSAGLRWEPFFPPGEEFGRATHFDMAAYQAGQRTSVFSNAPIGFWFTGDKEMPGSSAARNRWGNFAPRLGLVWDPAGNGRTTIRSAYSVQYDFPPLQYFDRFGFGPPWASTITIFQPAGGFADPYRGYPGGNPFPQPVPPPKDALFPLGGQFADVPLDMRLPYTQQWNLSIQHQFGQDWLASANYLGNKSTHRWTLQNLNTAQYIPGQCGNALCTTSGNIDSRRILTLLNPREGPKVGSLTHADDGAVASYQGLLLSLNRRFRNHFSALVNYTWSHCISDGDVTSEITGGYDNPNSRTMERGNCEIDIRHLFNASLLAETPRFDNRLTRTILGDWQLSAIFTKRSGYWFSPSAGRDNNFNGLGGDRANVVGDSHVDTPTLNRWFNTAAFAHAPVNTYGNAGRYSLQGPGAFTFDFALMRRIPIRERMNIQIRAEAFNAFNHPAFGNPRSSLTDNNNGRILTANDPRIFQFALKYVF